MNTQDNPSIEKQQMKSTQSLYEVFSQLQNVLDVFSVSNRRLRQSIQSMQALNDREDYSELLDQVIISQVNQILVQSLLSKKKYMISL